MSQLLNLIVELDGEFTIAWQPGIQIAVRRRPTKKRWRGSMKLRRRVLFRGLCRYVDLARRAGKPAGFATFDPHGMNYAWLQGVARKPGVGFSDRSALRRRARAGFGSAVAAACIKRVARTRLFAGIDPCRRRRRAGQVLRRCRWRAGCRALRARIALSPRTTRAGDGIG